MRIQQRSVSPGGRGVRMAEQPARLTRAKAAELLGVSDHRLTSMLRAGVLASLDLPDVLEAREQRWITAGGVQEILGVNRARVGQLVEAAGFRVIRRARVGGVGSGPVRWRSSRTRGRRGNYGPGRHASTPVAGHRDVLLRVGSSLDG